MDLAQCLLRQTKVHVNRIERLQLNDRHSRGQVLPEIDLANPENPRERGPNRFSLNGGADCAHIGFGLFLLGGGLVILQPGDDALFYKLLHPAIIDFCQIALRLESGKLRPLFAGVEFDENIAFPYRLAGIKVNFRHRSWKVGADHHAVDRLHGADHRRSRRPLLRSAPQRS